MWLTLLMACLSPPDVADWTPASGRPLWPDEAGAALPVPEALGAFDWLGEVSGYGERGLSAGRATAGSFGVGDGAAFGMIGLDSPWSTLTNGMGPGYQADEGFFGDSSFALWQDGAPLPIDEEAVQRPRGSAVVRTGARSGDLWLLSADFAAEGQILRLITLMNEGSFSVDELTLRLGLERAEGEEIAVDPRGLVQARGRKRMLVRCEGASEREGALELTPLRLEPGEERTLLCAYSFAEAGDFPEPPDPIAALGAHREAALALLAEAARLRTPDPKVEDLVEGMLLTMWTQTAPSGIVSPMNRYTKGWLRDAEGPVRLHLALGLPERAQAQLDATYLSLAAEGKIANSFSLDSWDPAMEEPEAELWETVPFMPGREPSEAPSYAPILQAAVSAATGAPLSEGRAAFLRACVERQEVNDQGLLPFSGDETFRYPMSGVLGVEPETLGWSAHASFLYVAAAEALDRLGIAASTRRAEVWGALESLYWQGSFWSPILSYDDLEPLDGPYEDVSLQPLWLGYRAALPERLRANADAVAAALGREDGTLLSPESVFGGENFASTGMVPGYWLANLAALHDPGAELAFDALDRVATPSGHFEELHRPDNAVLQLVHARDGLGGDVSARYRPWEGGVVVAGMLDWLIGARPEAASVRLRLAPHLPAGWEALEMEGLRVGADRYDLRLEGYAEGLVLTLSREDSGEPWTLSLELGGRFSEIWVEDEPAEVVPGDAARLDGLRLGPGERLRVVAVFE